MNRNAIILRNGVPTYEEGLLCGLYMNEASEGFFRFMLGPNFEHIIAQAYIKPNHSFSFENAIFVEHENTVVGMALGFTAKQKLQFSEQPLKSSSGYPAARVAIIKWLLAPLIEILETIPASHYYLLAIAIDEAHRGEGIGDTMMDHIEDQARASGSEYFSLDVAASNIGARRFYERRGMTVISQWPKRVPLPALRLFRMSKSL